MPCGPSSARLLDARDEQVDTAGEDRAGGVLRVTKSPEGGCHLNAVAAVRATETALAPGHLTPLNKGHSGVLPCHLIDEYPRPLWFEGCIAQAAIDGAVLGVFLGFLQVGRTEQVLQVDGGDVLLSQPKQVKR
jgi:hypothetical protein